MQPVARGSVADQTDSSWWWVFLVIGTLWLIAATIVLRFDERSVTTVGIIMGIFFLGAAATDLMFAAVARSLRWLYVTLAVLFALGAIWAFVQPEKAFWALASVLGLLLVLKGAV